MMMKYVILLSALLLGSCDEYNVSNNENLDQAAQVKLSYECKGSEVQFLTSTGGELKHIKYNENNFVYFAESADFQSFFRTFHEYELPPDVTCDEAGMRLTFFFPDVSNPEHMYAIYFMRNGQHNQALLEF